MMAYDSHRGRVVLFGGLGPGTGCGTSGTPECDDTWEWDGCHWLEVTSYGFNPPERYSAAMAFDSSRAVTLLFGGTGASGLAIADTWAWDGMQWAEQIASTDVPTARARHAMAYDPARGRVVLFGGLGVAPLADTWEWDRWGSPDCSNEHDPCWRSIMPVGDTPVARFNHAMAYDPALGGIVLFGGHASPIGDCNASGPVCTDTWLWNGLAWQDLSANGASTPPASCAATLVFDTTMDALILFGGNDGSSICNTASGMQQTWAFGDWGTPTCASAGVRCWKQLAPSSAPTARSFTIMAFHNQLGRAILFGGAPTSGLTLADTWEWIGENWRELSPSINRPTPRAELSMAYDTTHRSVLVFGGNHYQPGCNGSSTNYCGDLWSWDGVSWRELENDTSMARTQAAVAYQSSRDRLLLFGGYDGTVALSDTWEWDGSIWDRRCDDSPASDTCSAAPSGRYLAASTYDTASQVALVFGGDDSSSLSQETWGFAEWGLSDCGSASDPCWRDLTPSGTSPTSRRAAAMTYDSHRQVVVLFGGFDGSTRLGDTWEWNGSSWAEACTSSPCADNRPPARESATLAYDSQRRRIVLVGGYSNTGVRLGDAWEWDGSSWIAMTPTVGPRPAARRNAHAAFDMARQRLVYFGGDVSDEPRSDTWEWATDPTLRPAVVTHFEWSSYLGAAHEVRSLELSAYAGARGYASLIPGTGTEQSGAELLAWDYRAGQWRSLDTGSAGMGAGDLLSFTSSSATEAQQHVAGDFIHVLVQPREGLGTGIGLPAIDLDYLETTVRYRLTPP
jgi:hypothetical protein